MVRSRSSSLRLLPLPPTPLVRRRVQRAHRGEDDFWGKGVELGGCDGRNTGSEVVGSERHLHGGFSSQAGIKERDEISPLEPLCVEAHLGQYICQRSHTPLEQESSLHEMTRPRAPTEPDS